MEDLTGFVAVILIFGLPIIMMVMYYVSVIKKNRSAAMLKSLMIKAGADAETIKELLKDDCSDKKKIKGTLSFGTLRAGCCLIGLGLGALAGYFVGGMQVDSPMLYILTICGTGLGLLSAFIAEWKLRGAEQKKALLSAESTADDGENESAGLSGDK